jgi:phosphoribosylamine--glycine ligase
MGAYCDSAILTEAQVQYVLDHVIYPTVAATGFTGFLYAGLMMTEAGPKVLEFNVRLGDPETQPLMKRMASDFAPALMAAAGGELAGAKLDWHPDPAVCVVLTSGGYPGAFESGKPIHGISEAESAGATVFHAGTRVDAARPGLLRRPRPRSHRQRNDDWPFAIDNAYRGVHKIAFDGMHYRTDIGHKGLDFFGAVAKRAAHPSWIVNSVPPVADPVSHPQSVADSDLSRPTPPAASV